MKFHFAAIITSLSMAVSVSSNPVIGKPQPVPTPVGGSDIRCGGNSNLTCPTGWRCCGPFISVNGLSGPIAGSCVKGESGVCAL